MDRARGTRNTGIYGIKERQNKPKVKVVKCPVNYYMNKILIEERENADKIENHLSKEWYNIAR